MSSDQLQTTTPNQAIDERQQMLLDARAYTIGHCEGRLLDFQAWSNAFWGWLICNLLSLVGVGTYFFSEPAKAYAIAIIANIVSFPIALACARGTYTSVLKRYREDREAAGLDAI